MSAAGDLVNAVSRAILHIYAGTLRHAELDAMTARAWRAFDGDEVNALSGFMPWERELYAKVTRPGDRVLIVGCGSGRDLLPFVEGGHDVVGVEPSPQPAAELRALLRSRQQSGTVIEGFIERAPLPGEFDLVIFSWICYSYLRQRSRRVAVLKRIGEHLRPDGRVVLTYIPADGSRQARGIRLTRWVARLTGSDWTPENNDVITNDRNGAGERSLSYEHWFTHEEITSEAREAGLRPQAIEGPVGVPALVIGR